ncbi:hypothetical protein O9H85_00895 [Paenibacillus filicis]|uniref:DUF2029 domain-containing protein n=1 Tax=Paenibacillus gyeongsangnamensis TaxID=3388067 RepID=A0ABT4Q2A1_9BACL|nr:hypothetical protein [Paenibacillus filicis]
MNRMQEQLTLALTSYWERYSNIYTWGFWMYTLLMIVPLIVLYYRMDRSKALLLGFYGYSVHMLSTYIDAFGTRNALWSYPFQAIPLLVGSFALDISFIPVSFILLYQWTLNRGRNYYYYAIVLSAMLGLLFKPALTTFGLFRLYKGTTYVHLFIYYVIIAFIAKWLANLFLHFQNDRKNPDRQHASRKKFNLQRMLPRRARAR